MTKRKIELDPTPLDDEERDMIEAMDAAFERGDLKSELTPERKAEVEASARATSRWQRALSNY